MHNDPVSSFTFNRRNYGHWDVLVDGARLFRVRGGPGNYVVIDERVHPGVSAKYKTLGGCVGYISDELMFELIVAKGQTPVMIEGWNVE